MKVIFKFTMICSRSFFVSGVHPLLPLRDATTEIEFSHEPSVVNAIKKRMQDNLPGYFLQASEVYLDNQSVFIPEDIQHTLSSICLRPFLTEEEKCQRFSLDVTNRSSEPQWVFSESLVSQSSRPLFNPKWEIMWLDPGARIFIPEIKIVEGTGRENTLFCPVTSVGLESIGDRVVLRYDVEACEAEDLPKLVDFATSQFPAL